MLPVGAGVWPANVAAQAGKAGRGVPACFCLHKVAGEFAGESTDKSCWTIAERIWSLQDVHNALLAALVGRESALAMKPSAGAGMTCKFQLQQRCCVLFLFKSLQTRCGLNLWAQSARWLFKLH